MTIEKCREKALTFFSDRLNRSREELLNTINFYNENFSKYDNRIYEDVGVRVAHWWNYEDKNWFARRIDLYLDLLEEMIYEKKKRVVLIDVGFSVPYAFTRKKLRATKNLHSVLVDKESSSKSFYGAMSEYLGIQRKDIDDVIIADIENQKDQMHIIDLLSVISGRMTIDTVLIVACEIVEHLDNPEMFWKFIESINISQPAEVLVYVTLPIGQKIPSHTMEFPTTLAAVQYLNRYIDVEQMWHLTPPPSSDVSPYLKECVCILGRNKFKPYIDSGAHHS